MKFENFLVEVKFKTPPAVNIYSSIKVTPSFDSILIYLLNSNLNKLEENNIAQYLPKYPYNEKVPLDVIGTPNGKFVYTASVMFAKNTVEDESGLIEYELIPDVFDYTTGFIKLPMDYRLSHLQYKKKKIRFYPDKGYKQITGPKISIVKTFNITNGFFKVRGDIEKIHKLISKIKTNGIGPLRGVGFGEVVDISIISDTSTEKFKETMVSLYSLKRDITDKLWSILFLTDKENKYFPGRMLPVSIFNGLWAKLNRPKWPVIVAGYTPPYWYPGNRDMCYCPVSIVE